MREIARNTVLTSLLLTFICIFPGKLTAQTPDSSSSWLKVLANLEQYYVVVDNDFENAHLVQRGDSIQVKPGVHKVTIVWQTISDNTTYLTVKPGTTQTHRIYISSFYHSPRSSFDVIQSQRNLRITTDDGSSIYVDGEFLGKHVVQTIVKPGDRKITTVHPEYGELTKSVKVTTYGITDFARFNENPSKLTFAAKLIPGAEFIASKRYTRAALTYVGLGAITGYLIHTNNKYHEKYDEYDYWELRYRTSEDPSEIIQFRENALQTEDELQKISRRHNLTYVALGAAYLLSTFEAFRKPRSGYKGPSFFEKSQVSVVPKSIKNQPVPMVAFTYSLN